MVRTRKKRLIIGNWEIDQGKRKEKVGECGRNQARSDCQIGLWIIGPVHSNAVDKVYRKSGHIVRGYCDCAI